MEKAYFGAGCFWGVEYTFQNLAGVESSSVGFMGGNQKSTYKEVCMGSSGHAEVVEIDYDPSTISYSQLLSVFWNSHNPTTLNRQGVDIGEQYRSVIFYTSIEQKDTALAELKKLEQEGRFKNPIVTQVVEVRDYFLADESHQNYLKKQGKTTCGI